MGTVTTTDVNGTAPEERDTLPGNEPAAGKRDPLPGKESGSGEAVYGDTEPDTGRADDPADRAAERKSRSPRPVRDPQPRSIQIRLSTVLTAAVMAVLVVVAAVFAWLYFSAESTLSDRDSRDAGDRHATQVASDYALGASTIDYHDVKSWLERLKANTTPQLAAKFDATGPQLEQILVPLQWTSKATPLSATVTSESGGIYKVNAYLDVTSTSVQTPDGGRTTVTYSLTIDSNSGWKITDVGGLQNALPTK